MQDKRWVLVFPSQSLVVNNAGWLQTAGRRAGFFVFVFFCVITAIQHHSSGQYFTIKPSNVRARGIIHPRLCLLHKAAAPMQNLFNSPFAPIKLKVAVGVSVCPCIFFREEDLIALQVSRWRSRPEKRLMGLIAERESDERRSRLLAASVVLLKDGAIRQKPCCGSCRLDK